MEVAECIPLFPQFFLHLLSANTDLLLFLSSNHSFSHFLQLVPFISSSIGPVYIFHPLYVLFLHQNIFIKSFKHNHTTPHNFPLSAYLMLSSLLTCSSAPLYCCVLHPHHLYPLVHQLYTTHCPYHKSFCFLQNIYFIFSQTHFVSI